MYRLLLVDNEKAVLEALSRTLDWEELGFETVDLAEDGLAAWEMLRKNRYHVVITDIRMPRMDGLELLRRISESGMDTRTIMLTAFDEFDYVLQALRGGAVNYLMKPIASGELRASVISALNSGSVPSSNPADPKMFEEYFLRRWLLDGTECIDLDTRASLAGVNIFHRSYNVLLLRGRMNPKARLPEKICRLLSPVCEVWMLQDRPDEYVFVAGGKDSSADVLIKALEGVCGLLRQEQALLVVGRSVSAYTSVADLYRECIITAQSITFSPDAPIVRTVSPDEMTPLIRRIAEASDIPPENSDSISPLVQRAIQIIREQYPNPLSLGMIAQQVGTNANYLGLMFRQETGEYFSDYLNNTRIRNAQRLLLETDQTVGSIAAAVGYSSVNYFCQVFKKNTGQSPARFRDAK